MNVRLLAVLGVGALLSACGGQSPPASGAAIPSASGSASAGPTVATSQLAFVRDGELILMDLANAAESTTTISNFTPHAFTHDRDALIGVRTDADDPFAGPQIVLQPIDGGPVTVLVDKDESGGASGLHASPDGRHLVLGSGDAEEPGGLILIDLAEGTAEQITNDGAIFPFWSPDSQWIAYTRPGDTGWRGSAVDVATGAITTFDEQGMSAVGWTEDGGAVVLRGSGDEATEILVSHGDPETGETLTVDPRERDETPYEMPSPDGRWVAEIDVDNELWLRSGDGRVSHPLGSGDFRTSLTWSPDSEWLVWTAGAGFEGPADLFIVRVADGVPERLTQTPAAESAPVWGTSVPGF